MPEPLLRPLIKPIIKPRLSQRLSGQPWARFLEPAPPRDPDLFADSLASLLTHKGMPWPWWHRDEFANALDDAISQELSSPTHRPWPFLEATLAAWRVHDANDAYTQLEPYRTAVLSVIPTPPSWVA